MTRYIIYNRVSTKKQLTENQRAACLEKYESLKKEGDILLEFDEQQKTTKLPIEKRPKLKEMLDEVKKGDQLIVFKLDRLARHPQELINIWFLLRKKKVDVISLFDAKLDDEFICAYALVAGLERKAASERTKSDAKYRKLKKERYGKVPFGYCLDPSILQLERENNPSYGKPYKLIPQPKEQEAIKLMIDLYNQEKSFGHIARALEEGGYKTRTGNQISKRWVYNFLKKLPDETPSPEELVMTP